VQLGIDDSGNGVDGGAALQKILDHLAGDGLRISIHALLAHSVVSCENEDGGIPYHRLKRLLDGTKLISNLFKPSQAPGRLR
jgi:hypothetical protein